MHAGVCSVQEPSGPNSNAAVLRSLAMMMRVHVTVAATAIVTRGEGGTRSGDVCAVRGDVCAVSGQRWTHLVRTLPRTLLHQRRSQQ